MTDHRYRPHLPDSAQAKRDSKAVLKDAREVRAEHRRKNRPDREEALTTAVAAINAVQQNNRRLLGAAAWRDIKHADELRVLSDALQRERRKLRKML